MFNAHIQYDDALKCEDLLRIKEQLQKIWKMKGHMATGENKSIKSTLGSIAEWCMSKYEQNC